MQFYCRSFADRMKKILKISLFLFIFPIIPFIIIVLLACLTNDIMYPVIFGTIVSIIFFVADYIVFAIWTRRTHNVENDDFCINLQEINNNSGFMDVYFDNNIWRLQTQECKLIFDLKDYPLPKSYIATYFMRQFLFIQMNKQHLVLDYLFKKYTVEALKKHNLRNVFVRFHYGNKLKKIQIVKNFIPTNSGIKHIINRAPYYWAGGTNGAGPGKLYDRIKNWDEKKYWQHSG